MSLEAACDYLEWYQTSKQAALSNASRSTWFLSGMDTMDDLKTGPFDRATERTDWAQAYQAGTSTIPKLGLMELKVTILAGWYKDLRMIFACGPDNRIRTASDFDRAAYMHSIAAGLSVNALKNSLGPVKPKET